MLNPDRDPMGHAIADFQTTGEAGKLIVRSDICEPDEIPVYYLFRGPAEMPPLEIKALEACRGDVLDVGAGAGSHSLALAERGYNTSSIDISRLAVDVMKSRGVRDAECIDFFELDSNRKYDTLLFLMNGAGIAGTLAGLDNFLSCCILHLKPGGQIILDSSDLRYLFDSPKEYPDYYYGEVQYQMVYGDICSDPFPWLFVDFDNLAKTGERQGLKCNKLMEGENNSYLARLSLY